MTLAAFNPYLASGGSALSATTTTSAQLVTMEISTTYVIVFIASSLLMGKGGVLFQLNVEISTFGDNV